MTSFLVAPLWGYIADFLRAHSEIKILTIITSTIFTLLVIFVSSFGFIFIIIVIASSLRAPVACLVDALVIGSLPNKEDYGSMRLYGAISFGIF